MIQRIQSLYLFAITILIIVMLSSNIAMVNGKGSSSDLVKQYSIGATTNTYTYSAESSANIPDLLRIVSFSMMGIYAFIILLLFKNLKQQLKFARLNYVLIILSIFGQFASIFEATIGLNGNSEQNYNIGLFLPLLALVFNFFACRGIKRDIDLIGSADRLR